MAEIQKIQKIVRLKSGIEIWMDADRAGVIQSALTNLKAHMFITIQEVGETINSAEIEGVFTPATLADHTRRKNGEWKCQRGNNWHARNAGCDCLALEQRNYMNDLQEAAKLCGKCKSGWLMIKNNGVESVRRCDCAVEVDIKYKEHENPVAH